MKRAIEGTVLIMWVTVSTARCGGEPGSATTEPPIDDHPGQVDVDFDPVDPVDPEAPADPERRGLSWCLPRAVPYDLGQIPPLPMGFDADNFCDTETLTPGDTPPTRVHTYDPTSRVLGVETAVQVGPGDARVTYTLDEQGRVREVFRVGAEGWYSVSSGTTHYELDERGELVWKVATQTLLVDPETATDVIETVQQWQGDRLLSRDVHWGESGGPIQNFEWEYDDGGRLVLARLTDDSQPEESRVYEAAWAYHDSGLPASVERRLDGVPVERETWTFDESGELVSRTFEAESLDELAADHGGDRWSWQVAVGLDSYERRSDDPYTNDPWRDALPVEADGCALLPRGPGHGYPDGEPEYQLGVARDERPLGIGFAYGDTSYGWRYGDVAWYGHDGLGSAWYGLPLDGALPSMDVVVNYRDGQMVAESATVAPTFGGRPVSVERLRVIEHGLIVSDRLHAVGSGPSEDRLLRFGRDSAGHLVERELWLDDAVATRQTWRRDERGRAVEHAIEAEQHRSRLSAQPWESLFWGFGDGPFASSRWFWRYDGDRLVERGGGSNELHEERFYDERGRLIEVVGAFDTFDVDGSERYTYDEEDRLVEHCTSYEYPAEGATWTCLATVFDPVGRVAWRESWRTDGETPVIVELNDYRCTP